jgi:hypothetical protein
MSEWNTGINDYLYDRINLNKAEASGLIKGI